MIERPFVGEPLPLDLVNTQWHGAGGFVDFFDSEGAVRLWLGEHGFLPGDAQRDALLAARAAVRQAIDSPGAEADTALNAVLRHGYEHTVMVDGQPRKEQIVELGWRAPWAAAAAFAALVASQADRVRQCAHPDCTLYFIDTSRNGTRRWHSMDTCGARIKSARHYYRAVTSDSR